MMDKQRISTAMLEWLYEKGVTIALTVHGHVAASRQTIIGTLVRIAVLYLADRHNQFFTPLLQAMFTFLAEDASPAHKLIGIELWTRLLDEVKRPKKSLPDAHDPGLRLLVFRDTALKPLLTRMTAIGQSLLLLVLNKMPHFHQILQSPNPLPDNPEVAFGTNLQELSDILILTNRLLSLIERSLSYKFNTNSIANPSQIEEAENPNDCVEETEGHEASAIKLPGSWTAAATMASQSLSIAWLRCMLGFHYTFIRAKARGSPTYPSHAPLPMPYQQAVDALMPAILETGANALRCSVSWAASVSYLWTPQHNMSRKSLFLRQTSVLMSYLIKISETYPQHFTKLAEAGWIHETCRWIMRGKLTLSPQYLLSPFSEFSNWLKLSSVFTFACIRGGSKPFFSTDGPSLSKHPIFGMGADSRGSQSTTSHISPSGFGMHSGMSHATSVSVGEGATRSRIPAPFPWRAPANTRYYLYALWAFILMHIPQRAVRYGHMLHSIVHPLIEIIFDDYANVNDLKATLNGQHSDAQVASGSNRFYGSGLNEEDDEDDELLDEDEEASGLRESPQDDVIELTSEIARHDVLLSGALVEDRINALLDLVRYCDNRLLEVSYVRTEQLKQSSILGQPSPAHNSFTQELERVKGILGKAYRRLAWSIRFAAFLTCSTLNAIEEEQHNTVRTSDGTNPQYPGLYGGTESRAHSFGTGFGGMGDAMAGAGKTGSTASSHPSYQDIQNDVCNSLFNLHPTQITGCVDVIIAKVWESMEQICNGSALSQAMEAMELTKRYNDGVRMLKESRSTNPSVSGASASGMDITGDDSSVMLSDSGYRNTYGIDRKAGSSVPPFQTPPPVSGNKQWSVSSLVPPPVQAPQQTLPSSLMTPSAANVQMNLSFSSLVPRKQAPRGSKFQTPTGTDSGSSGKRTSFSGADSDVGSDPWVNNPLYVSLDDADDSLSNCAVVSDAHDVPDDPAAFSHELGTGEGRLGEVERMFSYSVTYQLPEKNAGMFSMETSRSQEKTAPVVFPEDPILERVGGEVRHFPDVDEKEIGMSKNDCFLVDFDAIPVVASVLAVPEEISYSEYTLNPTAPEENSKNQVIMSVRDGYQVVLSPNEAQVLMDASRLKTPINLLPGYIGSEGMGEHLRSLGLLRNTSSFAAMYRLPQFSTFSPLTTNTPTLCMPQQASFGIFANSRSPSLQRLQLSSDSELRYPEQRIGLVVSAVFNVIVYLRVQSASRRARSGASSLFGTSASSAVLMEDSDQSPTLKIVDYSMSSPSRGGTNGGHGSATTMTVTPAAGGRRRTVSATVSTTSNNGANSWPLRVSSMDASSDMDTGDSTMSASGKKSSADANALESLDSMLAHSLELGADDSFQEVDKIGAQLLDSFFGLRLGDSDTFSLSALFSSNKPSTTITPIEGTAASIEEEDMSIGGSPAPIVQTPEEMTPELTSAPVVREADEVKWTVPRIRLELSLLEFILQFKSWYMQYKFSTFLIQAAESVYESMMNEKEANGGMSTSDTGSIPAAVDDPNTPVVGSSTALFGMWQRAPHMVHVVQTPLSTHRVHPYLLSGTDPASHSLLSKLPHSLIVVWRRLGPEALAEQIQDEVRANLLLQICSNLKAKEPLELLDLSVARILDTLRSSNPPTFVVSTALSTFRSIALGSTGSLFPDRPVERSLVCQGPLSLQYQDLQTSTNQFINDVYDLRLSNTSYPSPIDISTIGADLLKTVCVQTLLRHPVGLLFPSLSITSSTSTSNSRLRTLLWSTLARLLFLHVSSILEPQVALLEQIQEQREETAKTARRKELEAGTTSDSKSFSLQEATADSTTAASFLPSKPAFHTASPSPFAASSSVGSKSSGLASSMIGTSSSGAELRNSAYVFSTADGASGWFRRFTQPLTDACQSIRHMLGLSTSSPSGLTISRVNDSPLSIANTMLRFQQASLHQAYDPASTDHIYQGYKPFPEPGSPLHKQLRPALIGLMRDLRGVLFAARNPQEFRLVTEWLLSLGIFEVLAAVSLMYRITANHNDLENIAVLVPLLRLLAEWITNHGHRIVFPPGDPTNIILYREGGRILTNIMTNLCLVMRSRPGGNSASRGFMRADDAQSKYFWSSSERDNGFLKLSGILLSASNALLSGGYGAPGIMAAYGDNVCKDLWNATLQLCITTPQEALLQRPKIAVSVFNCGTTLVNSAFPIPLDSLTIDFSHFTNPNSTASPAAKTLISSMTQKNVLAPVPPAILPSRLSSSIIPSPLALVNLVCQPSATFAAFVSHMTTLIHLAGSSFPRGITHYDFQNCNRVLEAILLLEAECRLLLKHIHDAAEQQQAPSNELQKALQSNVPVKMPSGISIAPSLAKHLVTYFDSHAEARALRTQQSNLDPSLAYPINPIDSSDGGGEPSFPVTADDPFGFGIHVEQANSRVKDGLWGVEFTRNLLLGAVRDAAYRGASSSRVLMLNILSRPAVFLEAAATISRYCASEFATPVRTITTDMAQCAYALTLSTGSSGPTSTACRDLFSREFMSWAVNLAGAI